MSDESPPKLPEPELPEPELPEPELPDPELPPSPEAMVPIEARPRERPRTTIGRTLVLRNRIILPFPCC